MKTKPFRHQKQFLNWAHGKDHVALFSEQGTGKTWMCLALIEQLIHSDLKAKGDIAILCETSFIDTWLDEIKKFTCLEAVGVQGTQKRRKDALSSQAPIKVMGYDILGSSLVNHVSAKRWAICAADESTNIKRWQAKRTKRAIKVFKDVPNKIIMTGTPITNTLFDLWSQFKFLDGGETFEPNFWDFRQKYFYPAGFEWKPKKGAQDRMKDLLTQNSFRVLKKDCLDLPSKITKRIPVELDPAAKKKYDEFVNDWMVTLEDGTEVDTRYVIQKMSYLTRLCSGYLKDKKVPCTKRKVLEDLLKELDHGNNGIVIWCRYIDEVEDVIEVCQKLKLSGVTFTGDDDARECVAEFQTNPTCRVFITTIKKGAKSITLTKASHVVYYGRDFDYSLRMQSEDRAHRIGSEIHERIHYYDIFTKGTVEESALQVIKNKASMIAKTLPKSAVLSLVYPS